MFYMFNCMSVCWRMCLFVHCLCISAVFVVYIAVTHVHFREHVRNNVTVNVYCSMNGRACTECKRCVCVIRCRVCHTVSGGASIPTWPGATWPSLIREVLLQPLVNQGHIYNTNMPLQPGPLSASSMERQWRYREG